MSKAQLQANNTKLSSLIERIQKKVEEVSASSLDIGTEIYVMESSLTPYIVIAKDHHAAGTVTIIRKYATSIYTAFLNSVPSSSADNKYSGSSLKSAHDSYYDSLPQSTKNKIYYVDLPVRSSANLSAITTIGAHMFPLSEFEYTGSGHPEGISIPYFNADSKRIAYFENGNATTTWTRSVTGGMNNYCRYINSSGGIGNLTVISTAYLRPACCIASSEIVQKDSDGNYVLGEVNSGGSVETCTVTVTQDQTGIFMPMEDQTVVYINESGEPTTTTCNVGSTFTVIKNSLFIIGPEWGDLMATEVVENVSKLYHERGFVVYQITGNAVLTYYS